MNNNRWYDKYKNISEVIDILKQLDSSSQEQIAKQIESVALSLKSVYKEADQPNLSIGLDRVLGLYKFHKQRRWYDKINPKVTNALKSISTLPEEDFRTIMESVYTCL